MDKVASREYLELCGHFWHTFKTPSGQKVLDELDSRFNSRTPFSADSDRVTSFFCGQQDVIRFINQLVADSRRNIKEADPDELIHYSREGDF